MHAHATNAVILIGTLINAGWRDTKAAATTRRTERGATVESFGLELLSPYGEPFVVPLEANRQTPGAELISKARIGTPIAIEGSIRRRIVTDRRYAVSDQDTGSRRAEVRIAVDRIREPQEDEPHNRSIVWLEGTITVPPRIAAHRALMDMDMARTIIQVRHQRPGGFGEQSFPILELMEVQITTPLAAAAYELYRAGNRVRIVGELDLNLIPQTRNDAANAKLAQLDSEWQNTRASILASATSDQERDQQLRVAVRRYRNSRAAMQEAAVLTVVVGHADLLDGTRATDAEVIDLLRESRQLPARRTRTTQSGLPTFLTNATEDTQTAAAMIMEAVLDIAGMQDAGGEVHSAVTMDVDVPEDIAVLPPTPEQPLADGRPRRRQMSVPATNGITDPVVR